jgi:RimJ/RimL family protein N-acetyltransferase
MAHPYWPLFDLVVRTPRLELRYPDDEMCVALAAVAAGDLFAGTGNQFRLDWTALPSPERERSSLQFFWRCRAELSPDHWNLPLAVVVDGEPAGSQALHADDFTRTRSLDSGSWLAQKFQGHGLGKEMRSAMLHLAFDGLGAVEALSGAFESNTRSLRVSRAVGYDENGEQIMMRGDTAARVVNFRMDAAAFAPVRRNDVVIENLAPCLSLLGLADDASASA